MAKITPFDVDDISSSNSALGFARQVKKAFIDLASILLNLSFQDNFKGFWWEGTIPASTELKIPIPTAFKRTPAGYVVTFCQGGTLQAGATPWSGDFVYLTNISAVSAAVGRVFFFV